ncbi:MAG: putative nucleotidyltransferase substrate binding domain-containing protein, partial [Planctomycetaceae bacterium]
VARGVEIAHHPAGEVILRQGGDPVDGLHVVRKGAVELVDEGRVIDLLGEGETFGQFSLLAHGSPSLTVRAHEDTLVYVLPEPLASEVLESGAGLTFVVGSHRRRLRAAADGARTDLGDARYRPVGSLLRRAPVTVDPRATIAEAARRMSDERVSSLLLAMPDGLAIVTDRDLRTKVVAGGVAPERPVLDIATRPVRTIDAGALAGDALTEMVASGVHHLPVLEHGRVVGVVTDTDLMGLGRHTPFSIKSAIARARSREDVTAAAGELPEVVAALVETHADPVDVSRVIALVIDAVTERLVDLGIADLGDPPAPFAWLALGSGARHEQALGTDQDHALAYGAGAAEAVEPYFAALAVFVTDGLADAGVPRCRGDAMAVHPTMRRSLEEWDARFRGWMDQPDVDASILSSIGFDFRRQAGTLEAEPVLDAAVAAARGHPAFLKMLGRRALALRPPTGFVRDLVVQSHGEHAGRLDVKHGGITIVTNLARAWGIAAGTTEKGTLPRLDAAVAAGELDGSLATELAQAFHFLWDVRLQHQAAQVRAGAPADDFVDPAALGAFQRSGLKEAFRVVRTAQRLLASQLGVDLR